MNARRGSERQRQHTAGVIANDAAPGDERGRAIARRRGTAFVLRGAWLCVLALVASSSSRIPAARAFCRSPASTAATPKHRTAFAFAASSTRTSNPASKSNSNSASNSASTTALGLLRPEWMRRAGRIEEKRREREKWRDSLRRRKEELGLAIPERSRDASPNGGASRSQRYRVVSASRRDNGRGGSQRNGAGAAASNPEGSGDSKKNEHDSDTNNNNNTDDTNNDDDDDLLKIYLVVPENEVEAGDESNVLDRLEHGEVVTSIRKRTVASGEEVPPAVAAASIIYNIDLATTALGRRDVLWIEHDRGGWSPSVVDGVTRLVPIEDNERPEEED